MRFRKEAAGMYRGGPHLRFSISAAQGTKRLWRVADKVGGTAGHVKRLKDARTLCDIILKTGLQAERGD